MSTLGVKKTPVLLVRNFCDIFKMQWEMLLGFYCIFFAKSNSEKHKNRPTLGNVMNDVSFDSQFECRDSVARFDDF